MSLPDPTVQPHHTQPGLPPSLDALRAELRRRWEAGERVPAELLLAGRDDRGLLLQLVFTELVLLDERGECPSIEHYRARLPELADEISRQMALLGMLHGDRSRETLPRDVAPPELADVHVPGYEVQQLLGRGGMGVVYLARQVRMNRLVALKMVVAGSQAAPEDVARFRKEAEAIARLNHPGIVQIYDTGEWNTSAGVPLPYFSMEHCPGGSLAARLGGTPQPPLEAARLARDLARAIQAAHDAGVVHRDLKPANVLLMADGTAKVTDFGLAKRLDSDDGFTQSDAVLGTPSYMAPEQAAGRARDLGPLVDVYSLGAVLFEMMVGRPPFKGATVMETLDQVQNRECVPPRLLRPGVPRDLETICLKCLHKDPARRYASAKELADDLDRFLQQQPILARPVGALERAWRWARRHPAVTGLSALSALAVVALVLLGLWFSARLGAADASARSAVELERAERFFRLLTSMRERSARPRPGWTEASLKAIAEAASLPQAAERLADLRSEAATCLGAVDVRPAGTLLKGVTAYSVAWSPDGKWLALGERASGWVFCSVWLVNPQRPEERRVLNLVPKWVAPKGPLPVPDRVDQLAFSPDGRWLVAGMRSGWMNRWDLTRPDSKAVEWKEGSASVRTVAFADGGRALFVGCGNVLTLWDTTTWKERDRITLPGPAEPVVPLGDDAGVACGPPGRILTGTASLKFAAPPAGDHSADLRLAADRFVYLTGDRVLLGPVYPGGTRDLRAPGAEHAHEGGHLRAAAPRSGAVLLSASPSDRHARLWDLRDGRLAADLVIGGGTCYTAFAPDGRLFAVLGEGETRLYEVVPRPEVSAVGLQLGLVSSFALHPDGRSLLTLAPWSAGGDLADCALWGVGETASAEPLARFPLHHIDARSAANRVALHGQRLLRGWAHRPEVTWRDLSGPLAHTSGRLGQSLQALEVGPDGRTWATSDDRLLTWDQQAVAGPGWQFALGELLSGKGTLYGVAVGRTRVAVACRDGAVRVFRPDDRPLVPVKTLTVSGAAQLAITLSPDERLALVGSERGDLTLIDLETGAVVAGVRAHEDEITAVAYSPDGLLISASADDTVRLWQRDGDRLRELATFRYDQPVRQMRLSPDGVTLYVLVARDRGVRVWHLGRLFDRFHALGLGDGLPEIAARPLPAAALSGPVELPPSPPGPGLRAELFRLPLLHNPVKVRTDPKIDAYWATGPDPDVQGHGYSVRWTGWLKAPTSGRYVLKLAGSTGMRLWLDGARRIDLWPDSSVQDHAIEVELTDRPHALRVEMTQSNGELAPRLSWSRPGGFADRVIEPAFLFTDRPSAERAKVPAVK